MEDDRREQQERVLSKSREGLHRESRNKHSVQNSVTLGVRRLLDNTFHRSPTGATSSHQSPGRNRNIDEKDGLPTERLGKHTSDHRPERRTALALRWAITYSKARPEKTMAERLAAELAAASKYDGASIKKKEDTHKMADANKAFAHYRW